MRRHDKTARERVKTGISFGQRNRWFCNRIGIVFELQLFANHPKIPHWQWGLPSRKGKPPDPFSALMTPASVAVDT
jgi:hypothetical protein